MGNVSRNACISLGGESAKNKHNAMEDEPVAKRKRKGVGEGTGEEGERMDLCSLPAAVAAVSKQQVRILARTL